MTPSELPEKPAGQPMLGTSEPQLEALDEFDAAALESFRARRERAVDGPLIPCEVRQAHMREWQEEWDRLGGFDMAYMQELRKRQMDRDQPLLFYHVKRRSSSSNVGE